MERVTLKDVSVQTSNLSNAVRLEVPKRAAGPFLLYMIVYNIEESKLQYHICFLEPERWLYDEAGLPARAAAEFQGYHHRPPSHYVVCGGPAACP